MNGEDPKYAAATAFAGIFFVCLIGAGLAAWGEPNAAIGALAFIAIIAGLHWLDMRDK